MTSEHEIYLRMKALLDSPNKWTKGAHAKTKDGLWCGAHSRLASCYCLTGALDKVYNGITFPNTLYRLAHEKLGGAGFGDQMVRFNDRAETTYEDVMALLDAAIIATMPTDEADAQ
jgi:hypothetical protein